MGEGEGGGLVSYLVDASFRGKVLQISVVHARFLLSHGCIRAGQQKASDQGGGGDGKDGGAWTSSSPGRSGTELSHHHQQQARWGR